MSYRSGYLDIDGSGNVIQAPTFFRVSDNTGTPKWSPVTANSTTATQQTFVCPSGALEVNLLVSTPCYVSPDASAGGLGNTTSHGQFLPANLYLNLPVKSGQTISVITTGAAGSCFFNFNMLNVYNNACLNMDK